MKTPTPICAKVHTLSNGATLRITDKEWASAQLNGNRAEVTPREAVITILLDGFINKMETPNA